MTLTSRARGHRLSFWFRAEEGGCVLPEAGRVHRMTVGLRARGTVYRRHVSDWSTKRLRLRRFTSADATFVLEVHQGAALRRFIPSAALDTFEQARRRVRDFEASTSPGRGWWCVTRRIDGLAVGALLLQPAPPSSGSRVDDIEVGWRAHPAYVGHGYMTEAAAVLMSAALTDGLSRVIALVDPSNAASIRVCERLQMTNLGTTRDYYDENLRLFEARRAL